MALPSDLPVYDFEVISLDTDASTLENVLREKGKEGWQIVTATEEFLIITRHNRKQIEKIFERKKRQQQQKDIMPQVNFSKLRRS